MTVWRGNRIFLADDGEWRYADTGQLVRQGPDRRCGECGLANTAEGHDGCLGTLPGVRAACCGHGDTEAAYILYDNGGHISGAEAVAAQRQLIALALHLPLRDEPHGRDELGPRPCPVCEERWLPWAGSRLPCHARCLLSEVGIERVRQMWADSTLSVAAIAVALSVPRGVIAATLHHHLGIRQRR